MWLLVVLIGWPLIEIALFVTLGGAIGLWPTLAIVLGSGFLGVAILRGLGMRSLEQMRRGMSVNPHQPLAEGLMTRFAAVLLILPGFLTDVLGVLLLIPPVQRFVIHRIGVEIRAAGVNLMSSMAAARMAEHPAPSHPQPGDVVEGDFEELEGGKRPTHPPSGWTKH
jgi:UPF0716 protein FxsA